MSNVSPKAVAKLLNLLKSVFLLLPVHVVHSFGCKIEAFDFGMAGFEGAAESWNKQRDSKSWQEKPRQQSRSIFVLGSQGDALTTSCDIHWPGRS